MHKTIDLDFGSCPSCGDTAGACIVIPSGASAYQHPDGDVETHMRIESAGIERPSVMGGDIIVRLAGAGSVDLILSAEAAEKIGLALIRASALFVGDPLSPSGN